MSAPSFSLQRMCARHEADIARIQAAIYPACYHERASFILDRRAAYPDGALVAIEASTDALLAYGQCYPWPAADITANGPPALSDPQAPARIARALAQPAEAVLFIHEVSVHAQRRGIGGAMMRAMLDIGRAAGLRNAVLVAVLGNAPLWERMGWTRQRALPDGYYASAVADAGLEQAAAAAAASDTAPALERTPSYYSTDMSAIIMTRQL